MILTIYFRYIILKNNGNSTLETFKRTTFQKLESSHFSLLLSWLQKPHVKKRWNQSFEWTEESIALKYTEYVAGHKSVLTNGVMVKKPIHAFIIVYDGAPIGYIQMYAVSDFALETKIDTVLLSNNVGSFDWYIGDEEYLRKGIGAKILERFLKKHFFKLFDVCLVDSESDNAPALKVYEKLDFKLLEVVGKNTVMMKDKY